jgi:galactose-1-phosphate uridylyltransferase
LVKQSEKCEVVVFNSDHGQSFAELTPKPGSSIAEKPGATEMLNFQKNHLFVILRHLKTDEEIGVTSHHPHGQIYAQFGFTAKG